MIILTPAYGRDYKSGKQILSDWNEEKDFILANFQDPDCGRYINKQQVQKGERIQVRYNQLRKTKVFIA